MGRPGDGAHRQRRAAARIAVHAGQDDAGDADLLVELGRHRDRVLADHGIRDQQRFGRIGDLADLGHLFHQLFVDGQTAGGIQDDHVEAALAALVQGAFGDGDRRLTRHDGQRGDLGLFAQNGKLMLRGRTLHVQRGHQHLFALGLLQAQRDLGRGGGLARALQADHQNGHRRRGVQVQDLGRPTVAALFSIGGVGVLGLGPQASGQHLDQGVMDDLDDHLPGGDGLDDLLPDRAVLDGGDELLDHRQGDVGLQQGDTHLAHGLVDVVLRDAALAAQLLQHIAEATGQPIEHASPRSRR